MGNQILEAISHIKNVNRKSPTVENIFNHISKTSASNMHLSFAIEIIKQLISKNKINNNFKIIGKPKNENLKQSTDEVQTLLNNELKKTLDRSPLHLNR